MNKDIGRVLRTYWWRSRRRYRLAEWTQKIDWFKKAVVKHLLELIELPIKYDHLVKKTEILSIHALWEAWIKQVLNTNGKTHYEKTEDTDLADFWREQLGFMHISIDEVLMLDIYHSS